MNEINLFENCYILNIQCDKPQRDGYNLLPSLSLKYQFTPRSNEGFIVETFVRAPVNLTIYFNQKVKLNRIVLNSKVNAHQSNGFIISTHIEEHYNSNSKMTSLDSFKKVARTSNRNSNECLFEFQRRTSYTQTHSTNAAFFCSSSLNYLDEVTAINICIIHTLNSTSPCIKSLKIFGLPSEIPTEPNVAISSKTKLDVAVSSEIPSQFFDELTHEVMKIPIKLPSGHFVDKSTLDKYLNEQKVNGDGVEKDPFTKVNFDSNSKPVVDADLKSRIDRFMLERNIFGRESNELTVTQSRKRKLSSSPLKNKDSDKRGSHKIIKLSEADATKCSCCQNKSKDSFYEINKCKHIYCRHCIFAIKGVCVQCKNEFNKSDVSNVIGSNYLK